MEANVEQNCGEDFVMPAVGPERCISSRTGRRGGCGGGLDVGLPKMEIVEVRMQPAEDMYQSGVIFSRFYQGIFELLSSPIQFPSCGL